MAKIGYFTNPKLADNYTNTFIGVKLADIDLKDKYARMPIDDGFKNLLETICSQRSGLVYTPYPKCCIMGSGNREWTYLIGIKPLYEFQEVNDKGNIRALYGGDNVIDTARYNERPYFDSPDDARFFIATRIAKFSKESVYDIAHKIGTYSVMGSKLMAMPEIKQEIKRELQNASVNEPNDVRLKALVRRMLNYMDIKYTNNRERQAFELLVVGFTDEELRFYGFNDDEIAALCKENKRLNKERSDGIAHRVAIRKDKAAHTWFAVGVQEGENLRTCGFEYYQTKLECEPELEWFRYTYPERRFKIALVIRDDINEKEVTVND